MLNAVCYCFDQTLFLIFPSNEYWEENADEGASFLSAMGAGIFVAAWLASLQRKGQRPAAVQSGFLNIN
jgi:hypothetical protein